MHVLLSANQPAASKHGGHPALDAGSRDQEIKSVRKHGSNKRIKILILNSGRFFAALNNSYKSAGTFVLWLQAVK